VKLLRTFAAQTEALQRYRGKGQQKVTVEHVHVHTGGQAIVGSVSQSGRGLTRMIENGPIPAIHGVVCWRLVDLCQWVFEEFRIHAAPQTTSRELHAMDYRKLSARPRHYAQADTDARRLFKAPTGC
jgi:hypothetical protein